MAKINVVLSEARSLSIVEQNGRNDPQCRITVGRVTKIVSTVPSNFDKKKKNNPSWSQELVFDVDDKSSYMLVQIFDMLNYYQFKKLYIISNTFLNYKFLFNDIIQGHQAVQSVIAYLATLMN